MVQLLDWTKDHFPARIFGRNLVPWSGQLADGRRHGLEFSNQPRPMDPILIAVLVFVLLVFGGALVGLAAGHWLPTHHQDAETRDAVKLVMGLIATVSALVLSLLIASAHNSYDTQENEVQQLGAHIAQFNQVLASYGPEADGIRAQLRRFGETELARIWRDAGAAPTSTLAPRISVRGRRSIRSSPR
jgi:hypothetical protein